MTLAVNLANEATFSIPIIILLYFNLSPWSLLLLCQSGTLCTIQ